MSRLRGHTLLELLVAMAIVATLASLATASYSHFVVTSRRFDARAALGAVAAAQERHYLRHSAYAARFAPPAAAADVPPGTLPMLDLSPQEHYALALVVDAPQGYRVEARPRGSQARDRECALFVLESTGMRSARDASGTDTTRRCWAGA